MKARLLRAAVLGRDGSPSRPKCQGRFGETSLPLRVAFSVISLGVFFAQPVSIFAQSDAAVSPSPAAPLLAPAAAHGNGGLAQVVLVLLFLVALAAGAMWFVRNGGLAQFAAQRSKGAARKLQISETRMLGNRQFLIVAEYEGRKMLIGVCPGRIDYLSTLSTTAGAADADGQSFAAELSAQEKK